jgi:RHS repeat-associated core domain
MEIRSAGIETRYGYQGLYAEKDKETGWNNFELRNYDTAIGRWLSTDPYSQFHSPYVGMGNNPVSDIDVDGGWSDGDDPPVKKVFTNVYNRLEEVVVIGFKNVDNYYKQNSKQINGVWNAIADAQLTAIPGLSQFEENLYNFTGYYIVPRFDEEKIDQKSYYAATLGLAFIEPGPNGEANLARKGANKIGEFLKDFSTKRTKNFSAYFKSSRAARNLAQQKLGKNPIEVELN